MFRLFLTVRASRVAFFVTACVLGTMVFLVGFANSSAQEPQATAVVVATAIGETMTAAPTEVEVYKKIGDVELSIFIQKPDDMKPGERRPAIVFFFGGGWVGGSPKQFFPHCHYFSNCETGGAVCFAAEYRIRSKHGTTPFECVADGKSAIRWVRENAARFGVDPERIVASGGSAGGHVAATTGTIKGLDQEGEDLTISSVPNAMMLFNPVIDCSGKGYGHDRVQGRMLEISPAHHVAGGIVPTIIFHGTNDTCVVPENVERFTAEMKKAGNTCQLELYEGQGHGFFNYGRGDGTAFWSTVGKGKEFLQKQRILVAE